MGYPTGRLPASSVRIPDSSTSAGETLGLCYLSP